MDPKFFEADPRNKLEIFQKVIEISKIVTNENFEIKCTNILKGEEPDKTNYFLQMFFKAATNGKDNSKFIQKYLEHRKKKSEEKLIRYYVLLRIMYLMISSSLLMLLVDIPIGVRNLCVV